MSAPKVLLTADVLPVQQLFLGWQELNNANLWL